MGTRKTSKAWQLWIKGHSWSKPLLVWIFKAVAAPVSIIKNRYILRIVVRGIRNSSMVRFSRARNLSLNWMHSFLQLEVVSIIVTTSWATTTQQMEYRRIHLVDRCPITTLAAIPPIYHSQSFKRFEQSCDRTERVLWWKKVRKHLLRWK